MRMFFLALKRATLICYLLVTARSGNAQVNVSDSLQLVNFYNQLGGTSWTTQWDFNQPVSTWYGITVATGRVTGINLSNTFSGNNLSGDLSGIASLNLPGLTFLNLSYNIGITGSVPDFQQLPALQFLLISNLANGNVSGSIPNFSALPNLQNLQLSGNKLTGTIPNFSNLPNLRTLYLTMNQLTGPVPDFNLPRMQDLQISSNQLSGTVPDFSHMPLISTLNLSFNQLSGTVPDFTGIDNVRTLLLNDNQFTGPVPSLSQINIANLIQFQLSSNQYTFSDFEAITNSALISKMQNPATGANFGYYAQTPPVTITRNGNIATVTGAGGTLSKEIFYWRNYNNGDTIAVIQGNASIDLGNPAYNLQPGDEIYVNVKHSEWTVPIANKELLYYAGHTINGSLPVIFGSLSAYIKNDQLVVNWSTLEEMNNDHFFVEISTDGKLFKRVGTVNSKSGPGNGAEGFDYFFSIGLKGALGAWLFPILLGMGVIQNCRKRKQWSLMFLGGLLLLFYSCRKSESWPVEGKKSPVYVRIVQVDKDRVESTSKTVSVVFK